MPYIPKGHRKDVLKHGAVGAGELNYSLTFLVHRYVLHKGISYQTINDVLGALEGAKQEFYRRVVSPYEDEKRAQNGDITV